MYDKMISVRGFLFCPSPSPSFLFCPSPSPSFLFCPSPSPSFLFCPSPLGFDENTMPLPIGTCLPPLDGATDWLDGPVATDTLQGRPTLVQFWAVSCPICKLNMPGVLSFLDTYQADGLQLLSVHMPRMEADMDVEKVRAVADELALIGPCAIDNAYTISELFQTGGGCPRYFLFDAGGKLRSRAAGQLGLKMAENSLKRMLAPQLPDV